MIPSAEAEKGVGLLRGGWRAGRRGSYVNIGDRPCIDWRNDLDDDQYRCASSWDRRDDAGERIGGLVDAIRLSV
ncbi:MAG: hypothetical protein C5B48_12435 [Candidatus Rokuibacteriota bacterium]|nr:MAG: hypothetical protein C5B48_12435 [Candidatus Rokubacteria bacterium]